MLRSIKGVWNEPVKGRRLKRKREIKTEKRVPSEGEWEEADDRRLWKRRISRTRPVIRKRETGAVVLRWHRTGYIPPNCWLLFLGRLSVRAASRRNLVIGRHGKAPVSPAGCLN